MCVCSCSGLWFCGCFSLSVCCFFFLFVISGEIEIEMDDGAIVKVEANEYIQILKREATALQEAFC